MTTHRTTDPLDENPRVLIAGGLRWFVYESGHPYDRRARPLLYFDCTTIRLRVSRYPANWRDLSDDDLWELAWKEGRER